MKFIPLAPSNPNTIKETLGIFGGKLGKTPIEITVPLTPYCDESSFCELFETPPIYLRRSTSGFDTCAMETAVVGMTVPHFPPHTTALGLIFNFILVLNLLNRTWRPVS